MTPTDTDPRPARAEARASLDAFYLSPEADAKLRARISRAKVDDLPSILKDAADRREVENAQLREKYSDLLSEARRAFLTDTTYGIKVAEAASAIKIKKENTDDPEQLRANILRLHNQGAGIDEIQRVLHTNRSLIAEVTQDAPRRAQDGPVAREIDPRDRMPDPRPVIPSKKLKKWTPEPLADDDERHGTNAGYSSFGCRCQPCIAARKAYRAERRANPTVLRAKTAEHGTRSRYSRGCRCEPCRAAASAYNQSRFQK